MTDTERAALASRILAVLIDGGGDAYYGEPVTQLEHAVQTAALAEAAGASDALVVAALLHDVGHMLSDGPENVADQGVDARHEDIGHRWLETHFGAAVTEPVRLHVAAKRYLCAVEPGYAEALSDASRQSLALQGGAMTPEAARAFAQLPWAAEAAALRRWDDAAKDTGREVPDASRYHARIMRLLEER
jgi:phosphonate degradation associated HDIG domain protein